MNKEYLIGTENSYSTVLKRTYNGLENDNDKQIFLFVLVGALDIYSNWTYSLITRFLSSSLAKGF